MQDYQNQLEFLRHHFNNDTELAQKLNISREHLNKVRNGKYKPSIKLIIAIENIYYPIKEQVDKIAYDKQKTLLSTSINYEDNIVDSIPPSKQTQIKRKTNISKQKHTQPTRKTQEQLFNEQFDAMTEDEKENFFYFIDKNNIQDKITPYVLNEYNNYFDIQPQNEKQSQTIYDILDQMKQERLISDARQRNLPAIRQLPTTNVEYCDATFRALTNDNIHDEIIRNNIPIYIIKKDYYIKIRISYEQEYYSYPYFPKLDNSNNFRYISIDNFDIEIVQDKYKNWCFYSHKLNKLFLIKNTLKYVA